MVPFFVFGGYGVSNVKLSLTSPMILHLLASFASLHLGKESKLSLRSTFGTSVEK